MTDLDHESSSSWSEKNLSTENSFSSEENEMKFKRTSPRTVLGICEEDSNSEGSPNSRQLYSPVTSSVSTESRKPKSPFNVISSFFRKKNDKEKKQQPMLRCFTYQELASATKNFHNGTINSHFYNL